MVVRRKQRVVTPAVAAKRAPSRIQVMTTLAARRSTYPYPFTRWIPAIAEGWMRKSVQVASWAVYQMTILGQPGPNVVCHQSEWDAIERAQPGLHRLIRGGITNEGEAERLARGSSGDDKRTTRKKAISEEQEDDGPLILPFSVLPQEISELAVSDETPDERMESA
jgi:hypothetical protein